MQTGDSDPAPFRVGTARVQLPFLGFTRSMRSEVQSPDVENPRQPQSREESQRPNRGRSIYKIGGTIMPLQPSPTSQSAEASARTSAMPRGTESPENQPSDSSQPTDGETGGRLKQAAASEPAQGGASTPQRVGNPVTQRTIRFPDSPGSRPRSPEILPVAAKEA